MMKFRKKMALGVSACVIVTAALLGVAALNSPNTLCMLAEGLNEPSVPYYATMERLYKISQDRGIGEEFVKSLTSNEREHLQNCYIRVLGITGKEQAIDCLMQTYVKYQHDENSKSTIYETIISMGLLGNSACVPLLEKLLERHTENRVQVPSSLIAQSLYLITGRAYSFPTNSGESESLYLSKEKIEARRIIEASQGRKRTFEEMVVLDKLIYRPPEYR